MFSQAIGNVTGLAVYGPAPGSWRLRSNTIARTRFSVRTIPALGKVKPQRIVPASTKRKPLPRKLKTVRLSWSHSGALPRDTRLSLYRAISKKAPGKLLRSGLRFSGRTTLKVIALRKGANYLYLVPRSKGIQFDIARFAAPVWKR